MLLYLHKPSFEKPSGNNVDAVFELFPVTGYYLLFSLILSAQRMETYKLEVTDDTTLSRK